MVLEVRIVSTFEDTGEDMFGEERERGFSSGMWSKVYFLACIMVKCGKSTWARHFGGKHFSVYVWCFTIKSFYILFSSVSAYQESLTCDWVLTSCGVTGEGARVSHEEGSPFSFPPYLSNVDRDHMTFLFYLLIWWIDISKHETILCLFDRPHLVMIYYFLHIAEHYFLNISGYCICVRDRYLYLVFLFITIRLTLVSM